MVGRFVGVTLMVDNIEEQYNRLVAKGVEFTGRPEKQHWGGTLAHLKDLDGNVLTLRQAEQPARGAFLGFGCSSQSRPGLYSCVDDRLHRSSSVS